MKKINVLSLFSGAGGLDIGFHLEGFHIKACIELNKDACNTLEANKGTYLSHDTKIYCEDITKLSPNTVKEQIGDIDFIIGGPPCQSFSAAGRRAGGVNGINDTRGSLFWYYAQYLQVFKPSGFLFENVKGILQANKSKDWEIIKLSFRELGYHLTYKILNAADYGTPQHRERVIMVGQLVDTPFKFPKPVFGPNSGGKTPYITPREAFADIDDPHEIVPLYSGKYGHLLQEIPPGLNYSFFTENMGHPSPLFAWRSKFSGFLYKLNPDEPCKTLVAQQGKYDGPFHWRNRKLNINELIRIQGFPIDYKFEGSKISIEKQIGNSVAPKLAQYMAKAVLCQCFGEKSTSVDLLEPNEELMLKKRTQFVKKNNPLLTKSNGLQASLFDVPIQWPENQIILKIHENNYENVCTLKDGQWVIKANNTNEQNIVEININIDFYQPVMKLFNKISCFLTTSKIEDFNIAWDFIHKMVSSSSSYESLQPLYGHFTEPYPKFDVYISTNKPNNAIHILMEKMSDYIFISKLHKFSELEKIFRETNKFNELIKFLRNMGVDIRTHETNRTIPQNYFRICYPFTIPSWQPTYIKWVDVGHHATADISLKTFIGEVEK